jgi:chemotaxis protein CheD
MATAAGSTLQALRERARQPGEASFFFYDARFACHAVKVLPGEYYVADDRDLVVTTTLGSCVAVCLWDPALRLGGMNHIMLPEGSPGDGEAAGRYGSFAMELLINALLRRGALRQRLQAKVFGGGAVVAGMERLNVGERNARFALDYLATERIAVLAQDLLDRHPRKVAFWPATGKAMVKRLPDSQARELADRERDAAQRPIAPVAAGSIDLF